MPPPPPLLLPPSRTVTGVRGGVRVQGAARKTRWTLGRGEDKQQHQQQYQQEQLQEENDSPPPPPYKASDSPAMQTNGHHYFSPQQNLNYQAVHSTPHAHSMPRFAGYPNDDDDASHDDDSQYASSRDSRHRSELAGWKQRFQSPPAEPVSISVNGNRGGGGEFDGFDFHQPPMNDRAFDDFDHSTPREEASTLRLDTHIRPHHASDAVGRHLLYETALLDTQTWEILDIAEVDALKKEQSRLKAKIEGTLRKLALESKVRDAAQNLQRLYSTSKRPDTPQSPDSPKKNRSSLRPDALRQADSELAASVKKVDELHDAIRALLSRREEVERRLLKHTAAVLAEEANRASASAVPGLVNGNASGLQFEDGDYVGHAYSDFDGIRDILHGRAVGASSHTTPEQAEQVARVQTRLEQLNFQLRNIISEAGQTLGRTPAAEVGLDQSDDSTARMDNRFVRLEQNLKTLEQQQRDMRAADEQHVQMLQQQERDLKSVEEQFEDADRQLNGKIEAIEEHLEGVNGQLHSALLQLTDNQPVPGLGEPPRSSEHGYQDQLQYMEEGFLTMEQLLQQRGPLGASAGSKAQIDDLTRKNREYEEVIGGLWETFQSDNTKTDQNDGDESASSLREPFSLQAFNTRAQRIFQREQAARDQHDILRRQIQQQRDLGGKSDMEKEAEIADLKARHDKLAQEHGVVQEELEAMAVKHDGASREVEARSDELKRVQEEVEKMQRLIETRVSERDEVLKRNGEVEAEADALVDRVREMEKERDEVEGKHREMHDQMEKLEGEVVRLTTELTMAKAELDGAYGTRAQRAGAQKAEIEALNEKNRDLIEEITSVRHEMEGLQGMAKNGARVETLERELKDLTEEFQELTRESIALERERGQLDTLIDGLRDRCEELEGRLGDRRLDLTGLGTDDGSVSLASEKGATGEREKRHIVVLKQEFKRMMREQRAEGGKALRAEQDERRKLETELRKIRQAGGPLGKNASSASPAPVVNGVPGAGSAVDTPIGTPV